MQKVSKEINALIKGFVAGQMTSDHNTAEGFDLVMNYDEDDVKKVRDCYEGGVCPDCGNPIPEDAEDGEECVNCEHAFYLEEDEKPYAAWGPFENWPDEDFAGAMSDMHSSATHLVQNAIAALTVDELIAEIRLRESKGRISKAIIIWSPEDVRGIAAQMHETLTDEEIDEILYRIDNNHDAEYGVNWETIRSEVECIVSERA